MRAHTHIDDTRGRSSSCRAGGVLLLGIESRSVPSAGALQTNRPHEAGRQAGRLRGGSSRYEGCTATTTTATTGRRFQRRRRRRRRQRR